MEESSVRIRVGEHGAAQEGAALAEGGKDGHARATFRVTTIVVEQPGNLWEIRDWSVRKVVV